MAYATRDQMVARYGAEALLLVADRDRDGIEDAEVISAALDDASAEIDVELGGRYQTPISPVPAVLVRLCVDIAMYRAAWQGGSVVDEWRKRYEDALRLLRSLASGEVALAGAVALPSGGAASVELSGPERIFGRGRDGGIF